MLLPPDPDLRLQHDAGALPDARLYKLDRFENVGGRCAAGVDNEARVLFGDLRAAETFALEPDLFDERTGKIALRALERAAGGRQLERL